VDKQFKPLNSGEVLSVSKSNQFMIGHGTFRVQEFMNTLKEQMIQHGFGSVSSDKAQWLSEDGIECEVLQFGSNGWQKGKVRLYLEFAPDQSVEPPTPTPKVAVTPVTPVEEKPAPLELITAEAEEEEEEMIVETTATATAAAELEIAQEQDLSFDQDFETEEESDLGFEDSFNEEIPLLSDNLGDDFEDEGLGFEESVTEDSADEGDFNLSLEDDDNGFDFSEDLGGEELGESLTDDNGFGDDDFDLGDNDFDSSKNTDGEGLGIGDVFNDESLDLNLGDDSMDDVWGEMEDL